MLRFLTVGLSVYATACYKPSFHDCAIACDDSVGCPSGLSCESATHMCTSGASCMDVTDGNGSGSGSSSSCWSMPTSNFDPCVTGFPLVAAAIDTSVSDPIIATDNQQCKYTMTTGGTACLLHVASITIASGHPFGANGSVPLILVSDGPVEIDALVSIAPGGMGHMGCDASQGATGNGLGGGGAGGGFGASGGSGGANDQGTIRPGGSATGSDSLEPLVTGCEGGNGGLQGGASPTPGGLGGGAIEISSKVSISIAGSGFVFAPGAGGKAGAGGNGGGGGGAGGAILLEAPDLMLGGAVCAPGGGGAAGVGANGNGGTSTTCAGGAGGTLSGTTVGGVGGASPTALPGSGSAATAATGGGGGGGGGAYGRIHFHTLHAPTGTAIVKPPAT